MNTSYELTYDAIVLTATAKTAVDHWTLSEKVHCHSEYDTQWDTISGEWRDAEMCSHILIETFKGISEVIFKITFVLPSRDKVKVKEFLRKVESYFTDSDGFGMIHLTSSVEIDKIERF